MEMVVTVETEAMAVARKDPEPAEMLEMAAMAVIRNRAVTEPVATAATVELAVILLRALEATEVMEEQAAMGELAEVLGGVAAAKAKIPGSTMGNPVQTEAAETSFPRLPLPHLNYG